MSIFFALAFVVGICIIFEWLHKRGRFYQYLFFCRVPLIAGLALILLPLAAATFLKELIGNWFASIGTRDAAILAFLVLLAARTLCHLVQVVFMVAPVRTRLTYVRPAPGQAEAPPHPPAYVWPQRYIVVCVLVPALAWSAIILRQSEQPWSAAGGLVIGAAAFVAIALVVRRWASDPIDDFGSWSSAVTERAIRRMQSLLPHQQPNPAKGTDKIVAKIRVRAVIFFVVFLLLYVAGLYLGHPVSGSPGAIPLPAYPVLILTLAALILTRLSTLLDSRRIPVALVALGWPILCYSACDTDHEYALLRSAEAPHADLDEDGFVRAWMGAEERPWGATPGGGGTEIPIVVTASGGGITASYWTACVLDRLRRHAEFGDRFARSLMLASAVSGGSAGAAFWLQEYADGDVTPAASAAAVERAGADCLASISWGLAYPDTMRLVLPMLASDNRDRGWALEAAWLRSGMDPQATLLTWRSQAARGLRPTAIFNATLMESGQRLMLALHDPRPGARADGASAQSWLRLYRGWDLSIATAARLSATFPYVAPVAKPAWNGGCPPPADLDPRRRYHVADGGYFDNDGVASALDFLAAAMPALVEEGAAGLLLVRIRAYPVAAMPDARAGTGWSSALLGPILTMLKARTSSQVDRNRSQLQATLDGWRGQWTSAGREFRILDVTFELPIESTLSWYLTDCEKRRIRESLDAYEEDLSTIARFLAEPSARVEQKAAR